MRECGDNILFHFLWHVTAHTIFRWYCIPYVICKKLKYFFFFKADGSSPTQTTTTKWLLLLLLRTTGPLLHRVLCPVLMMTAPPVMKFARSPRNGTCTDLDFATNAIAGLMMKPTLSSPAVLMIRYWCVSTVGPTGVPPPNGGWRGGWRYNIRRPYWPTGVPPPNGGWSGQGYNIRRPYWPTVGIDGGGCRPFLFKNKIEILFQH